MDQSNIQLTTNGLHSLLEGEKKNIIVQVLSAELLPERKPGADSLKYKVVISDGFAKHKAVFGNRAAYVFQRAGAPALSIVRAEDVMQLNASLPKKLIIVTELAILDTNVKEIIGYPVDYQSWTEQASMYENLTKTNDNTINSMFSTTNKTDKGLFRQQTFPSTEKLPKQSSPFQILQPKDSDKSISDKKPSPDHELVTQNPAMFSDGKKKTVNSLKKTKPSEVKKSQEKISGPNESDPTGNESNIIAQRAIKQLNDFPVLGIHLRDFKVADLQNFHQATDKAQAFSADFYDKNGNKVSAIFFGENVDHFVSILNGSPNQMLMNLSTKMDVEK